MRFTRLRLNGFKSFVDPTDLLIHDGLTGVVGPNGCGKSNLLEALRWVMGENRPTAMRGDGMEDVIFAGASTRPARHFAEVALVIDNSDRLAPAGFNDADTLEIARRITRDAGSAYRVNGREVRARDVQILFADAATGAHSPALVRQGQIAELISARPRSRRRVLEDAAGIAGLYQRRHEAELRLAATEANLARVEDVIEQLAQQLSALARQARQAARYREIGEALRRAEASLLVRRWREADQHRAVAERGLGEASVALSRAEAQVRGAIGSREAAEQALPALREEEAIAGAILQRLALRRDALAGDEARAREALAELAARISLLERDAEREAALNRDAGAMIERLDWESEQIRGAQKGHDARLDVLAAEARAAATTLAAEEAVLSQVTEDDARLSARHQSTRRLRDEIRATRDRLTAEAASASAAAQDAEAALGRAQAAHAAARAARDVAEATADRAVTVLTETEAARAESQEREGTARAARSAAEGEANALRAEIAAVARLIQRESGEAGAILDRVEADPGYEAALGAALADDLRMPEAGPGIASGWVALDDYPEPARLPAGVTALSDHVRVPAVLARRIARIGLVARSDGDALQTALLPGQRLVSREGDLWRWDGMRVTAEDAPSAAAERLRQLNRLTSLKRDLEEVAARAEAARRAHESLQARLADLTRADQMAREARRAADQALAEASRELSRAEADQAMVAGRLETARASAARLAAEVRDASARHAEAEAMLAALPALDESRARLDAARAAVEAARAAMLARRAAHDEARREGEARVRRLREIEREQADWRQRLATAEQRAGELAQRLEAAQRQRADAETAPDMLAAQRSELAVAIAEAESRRARAADRLSRAEAALRSAQEAERAAERIAADCREGRARAEARLDAAAEALSVAEARIAEDTGAGVADLLERLGIDPDAMASAEVLEAEIAQLRRAREALGAVNLRAEEDARQVEAEHATLKREKLDLEEAVRKLRSGIAALNREGRERLLTAFEQVNASFAALFTHLFGGGEARLVLVESDDPLEAGLEIMCQPPGKRLSTLSLLSGGEQTLTALALIFAVFLTNPSPICVLDEVDAPLDDANVARFCDLLDEMTRRTETRFLIITHHAVTMSRMDRLFGVTMAEQGVSQLVSVDLRRAEQMVA
ncbi:MAG: chromosome segregation SMC family protein [Gemmobacter sp.]